MSEPEFFPSLWWITVFEIPAFGGLLWMILKAGRDHEEAMEDLHARWSAALAQIRDGLAAYKLEVAKTYVSIPYLKDVEQRLTSHLLRIEEKLGNLFERAVDK